MTLALAPYDMFQQGDLSTMHILAGRTDEAMRMVDKAIAGDPTNRAFYQQLRGWALCVAGRHQESIAALDEAIELPVVPLFQAINLVALGREDEAKKQVEKARALQKDVTIAKWVSANFYRDESVLEKQVAALAAAGLP